MKLTIAFLFALGLFAQAPPKAPAASPAPAAKPAIDKDLFTIYESFGVKVELVQRRAEQSVEQLKKNVESTVTELQKQQETARQRICTAAKLESTCAVTQDPKTGDWSAAAAPPATAEPAVKK
jgi:hypothetical protein